MYRFFFPFLFVLVSCAGGHNTKSNISSSNDSLLEYYDQRSFDTQLSERLALLTEKITLVLPADLPFFPLPPRLNSWLAAVSAQGGGLSAKKMAEDKDHLAQERLYRVEEQLVGLALAAHTARHRVLDDPLFKSASRYDAVLFHDESGTKLLKIELLRRQAPRFGQLLTDEEATSLAVDPFEWKHEVTLMREKNTPSRMIMVHSPQSDSTGERRSALPVELDIELRNISADDPIVPGSLQILAYNDKTVWNLTKKFRRAGLIHQAKREADSLRISGKIPRFKAGRYFFLIRVRSEAGVEERTVLPLNIQWGRSSGFAKIQAVS